MIVQPIHAVAVPQIWDKVLPMLQEVARTNRMPDSLETLHQHLLDGTATLILFTEIDSSIRGIIVAYFIKPKNKSHKIAFMNWMFGVSITNLDVWEQFVKLMRKFGVHEVVGETAPQVIAAWKTKPFWKKYKFTSEGATVRANIWP